MPNNPVQIVLNDNSYLRAPDPGRMGPDKDFFEGRDEAFIAHRGNLIKVVEDVATVLRLSPYGPLGYLRVKMRLDAIAKSYRPNRGIFHKDQFPCVGAGAPGELYFRAPLIHIHRLIERMASAEDHGVRRISKTTGEPYHFVSRERSELGAIETIETVPAGAKRKFSASDAIAAFADPRAASGYIIELFEQEPLMFQGNGDILGFQQSFDRLTQILTTSGAGLSASILPSSGSVPSIEVLLTTDIGIPRLEDRRLIRLEKPEHATIAPLDNDVARHEELLNRLSEHPLVRRVRFPIMIEATSTSSVATPIPFNFPTKTPNGVYPKVGIVDTGVQDPHFASWINSRHDFLKIAETDPNHGTLVAGVLIAARSANTPELGREEDGCEIADIPLMPNGPFMNTYGRRGFEAFLEELEAAIIEARDNHGVRIFNMSINITSPVEPDVYSIYASRLDAMQDRLGVVVVVNSAGNLLSPDWRAPWAATPTKVLSYFASRPAADTISMPSESVRSLAVGALNPPGSSHIVGAPATYSRRGPGLRVGVKPDLAHYGGTGDVTTPNDTQLISCDSLGMQTHARGTSFAAPLVSKTLASLDIATGERLAPRTLRAFLIHNATSPEPLKHSRLKEISRQFVGFGQPSASREMLDTSDYAITLVFESRLTAGERRPAILRFPFTWPASLVDTQTRACRGKVSMTLVYDAPLDDAFGNEFVRVNLDAFLRQRQPRDNRDGTPSFHDQITQAFLPKTAGITIPERILIDHGLKWWPTKRYAADFKDGVGFSSEWRLEVKSSVRAEAVFPAEGIPFSLILCIEDPALSSPIFQELSRQFNANRVQMQDIRVATRVRAKT